MSFWPDGDVRAGHVTVKTDLLNFILGVYIILKHKNRIWYLVAYYNQMLILVKLNYNIYNKKLILIIVVLKKWRAFL